MFSFSAGFLNLVAKRRRNRRAVRAVVFYEGSDSRSPIRFTTRHLDRAQTYACAHHTHLACRLRRRRARVVGRSAYRVRHAVERPAFDDVLCRDHPARDDDLIAGPSAALRVARDQGARDHHRSGNRKPELHGHEHRAGRSRLQQPHADLAAHVHGERLGDAGPAHVRLPHLRRGPRRRRQSARPTPG